MSNKVELTWRPSFTDEEQEDQTPDQQLRQAVFQALGAASMCWDDIHSAGVFRSDVARSIGDGLLEWLHQHGEWSVLSEVHLHSEGKTDPPKVTHVEYEVDGMVVGFVGRDE